MAKAKAAESQAAEKARLESIGVMKERSAKIPREAGGLRALLTRYLDNPRRPAGPQARRRGKERVKTVTKGSYFYRNFQKRSDH